MNPTPALEKIAIKGNISLMVGGSCKIQNNYASSMILKGLLLAIDEKDLSEEGIGFGVPILKFKNNEIFPGNAQITIVRAGDKTVVTVDYDLNLVESMAVKGNKIDNMAFYRIKDSLSCLHRNIPRFRKILTQASNALRRSFNLETRFMQVTSSGIVRVIYIIQTGNIHVNVDIGGINKNGCTEIMLMNEQGASYFDIYHDSNGAFLKENSIGTWNETFADEAYFRDSFHGIEFMLQKVDGAKMFRGREYSPGRLAWSGLAYSIHPCTTTFSYYIRILT
jgi:hypothetical protein